MTGPFAVAIIVVALILGVWALVLAAMNKLPNVPLLVGAALLELMLLIFVIGGIVQMIQTDHSFSKLEFLAYLLGCLVIPPLGIAWSWGEKSRSGMVVIAIAFLIMPIMIVRVQQVWAGVGA